MQNQAQKLAMLQELSESEFRQNALIPLLKKMGYKQVRERHGTQEYGKDITFCEQSEFGDLYYAVVAKVGDISGAASGSQNLSTVKNQIDQAFSMPFEDAEDKGIHHIDRVIVWTSGKISNNAERQIVNAADERYKYVIFKGEEATIDLLERNYPAFFTIRDAAVSDYYNAAKKYYSRLEELRTLGTNEDNHQLPVIFVAPTFTEQAPYKTKEINGEVKIRKENFSFSEIKNLSNNIVMIGGAGSGKTTLIRKLFLSVIEENESNASREPIPVIAKFKQMNLNLDNPIFDVLKQELLHLSQESPWDNFEDDLLAGKVIVYLDGLDELENKTNIEKAVDCIQEFSLRYPETKIFLTSRYLPLLEQPSTLPRFRRFRVNDLEPKQMVKFVENWYGQDTEICRKLIKLISNPTSLRGLPATPMTLAILAILHERNPWQEVPANQTELFSKYIELALGRWDASKDISVQFEYPIKKFFLQQISWDIHQRNSTEISLDDFDDWVSLLADEHALTVDLDVFKKEVIERSELLFRNDKDKFEFKHRSFQDYFVGAEINRQFNSLEIITKNMLDPWWSSAIFFASGLRPDNEQYIDAILKDVNPTNSQALFFVTCLGELIQATFMATKQTKMSVTHIILDELINSWEYTCDYWEEIGKTLLGKYKIFREVPPHILFLMVHVSAVRSALGSFTMSPVLSTITDELLSRGPSRPTLSNNEIAKEEWKAFLLAMACANCDSNADDFLRLYRSGLISEPSFLYFGSVFAREITEKTWLRPETLDEANRLFKKLDKKWKDNIDYRIHLKKVKIIHLPSITDSA